MEENAGRLAERILNLTLDIICLLTGESYIAFKLSDGLVPANLRNVRSPKTSHPPPSPTPERRGNKEVQEATREMIKLLTGEVPIRCEDVAVYLSMEERKYRKGHCDLYQAAMMEEEPTFTPTGSSGGFQPMMCPPSACWNEHPKMDDNPSAANVSSLEDLNTSHALQAATPFEEPAEQVTHHLQNTNSQVKVGLNIHQVPETLTSCEEHLLQSGVSSQASPSHSDVYRQDSNIEAKEEPNISHMLKTTVLKNDHKVATPCKQPEEYISHSNVSTQGLDSNIRVREEPNLSHISNTHKVPTPREQLEVCPSHSDVYRQDCDIQIKEEPNLSRMVTDTRKVPTSCEEPEVDDLIDHEMTSIDSSSKILVKKEPLNLCEGQEEHSPNPKVSTNILQDSSATYHSMTRTMDNLIDHEMTSVDSSSKILVKKEPLTRCEEREHFPNPEVATNILQDFSTTHHSMTRAMDDLIDHEMISVISSSNILVRKEPLTLCEELEHFPNPKVSTNIQVKEEATIFHPPENVPKPPTIAEEHLPPPEFFTHVLQYSDKVKQEPVTWEQVSSANHHPMTQNAEDSPGQDGVSTASFSSCAGVDQPHRSQYSNLEEQKGFPCSLQGALLIIGHQENVVGPGRTYSCLECGKCYSSNSELAIHRRVHLIQKLYACTQCDKSFTRKSNLAIHQRTHTGKTPYACTECDKCFTSKSNLVMHLRTHTGERPFSCAVCGKRFRSNSDCVIHRRIHTGEKPYSCSVCGRSFVSNSHLVSHQRGHTGERPHSCPECGKRYRNRSDLHIHHRSHTGERPFTCKQCGKAYICKASLARHKNCVTSG